MQQGTGDMSEEHWVWRFNIYKSGNDVPLDHWKGHQTLKEGGINSRQSDKEAWFSSGNPGDFCERHCLGGLTDIPTCIFKMVKLLWDYSKQ